MSSYRRHSRSSRPAARWMTLKYAGSCCYCGGPLGVGARAWYDPADRTVTCVALPCARRRGLTRDVWHGSPVSGLWVETLVDTSLGLVRDPGEDMADRWNETH